MSFSNTDSVICSQSKESRNNFPNLLTPNKVDNLKLPILKRLIVLLEINRVISNKCGPHK